MTLEPIPELDALPQYDAWISVVKSYSRCQRLLNQRLGEIGLTVAKHDVLLALRRNEGLSQQALARYLLVAKSNVTGLVKRLGADGLIRREPDPDDARGQRVYLTREGKRRLARAIAIQAEVIVLMTDGISAADSRRLEKVMRAIDGNLRQALA
ncbi:MAG: MarR family transcriptional regulator [Pseudomonadota bacterium]